jgi:hypothetical protein
MEKKEIKIPRSRTLRDNFPAYPSDHPERLFQMDKITRKTRFLWFISKEETGFKATWAWNADPNVLVKFLIDGIAKKNVLREFAIPKIDQDPLGLAFDEAIALCFAASVGEKRADLQLFSHLATGEADLLKAASLGQDLNKASEGLMDATSHFFWSLSWQFYADEDEALKVAKTHPLFNQRDLLENAFQNDSSL